MMRAMNLAFRPKVKCTPSNSTIAFPLELSQEPGSLTIHLIEVEFVVILFSLHLLKLAARRLF